MKEIKKNGLMDTPIAYDELIEEALQHTKDKEEALRFVMKKTRGLANPYLVKEKLAEIL